MNEMQWCRSHPKLCSGSLEMGSAYRNQFLKFRLELEYCFTRTAFVHVPVA
jgi:hypothetical protein